MEIKQERGGSGFKITLVHKVIVLALLLVSLEVVSLVTYPALKHDRSPFSQAFKIKSWLFANERKGRSTPFLWAGDQTADGLTEKTDNVGAEFNVNQIYDDHDDDGDHGNPFFKEVDEREKVYKNLLREIEKKKETNTMPRKQNNKQLQAFKGKKPAAFTGAKKRI